VWTWGWKNYEVQKRPCGLDFGIFNPVSSESPLPAWSTFGQQFTKNNPPVPWVSLLVPIKDIWE